jgi:MoxR-like ATPase
MHLDDLRTQAGRILDEVERAVVGKRDALELVLLGLLADGHVLIEDFPGLAKTLAARSFAQVTSMRFSRIQFTPDLMPSDVTGSAIYNQREGDFEFRPGPIFANLLLADEINRAPPKTQAALLEAMQEHRVTAAGKTYQLPEPFFVLATQNPIEHDGTYSLPEAQLDRFMFELKVGYPTKAEEEEIVNATTGSRTAVIEPVLTGDEIIAMQQLVRRIPAPPSVVSYAVNLARSTRPGEPGASADVRKYVSYGAGPRASQYLVLGAKARAAIEGRSVPDLDDVKAVSTLVLGHRVTMNFQAEADNVEVAQLLKL